MPSLVVRALRVAGLLVAVVLGGVALVGATHQPNTTIPEGFAGRHIPVQGTPIRVLQEGQGRDVLFIHGSPGSVEDWAPVMRALAGSFRVTAFDRPGHGFSGDTGEYSFSHNADVALAVIDALKLEHVIVVGHSYGGAIALAMATRAPAGVDAYVVLDSATYTQGRKVDATLRLLGVPVFGLGFATLVGPMVGPKKIEKGIREQFVGSPPEGFVPLRLRIWGTPKVMHAIAAETIGAAAGLAAQSPRYPGIKKPVYVVAEADSEFRRATAEHLGRDIAGSSIELLHGTGHYVQVEKTAEVVATIRRAASEH